MKHSMRCFIYSIYTEKRRQQVRFNHFSSLSVSTHFESSTCWLIILSKSSWLFNASWSDGIWCYRRETNNFWRFIAYGKRTSEINFNFSCLLFTHFQQLCQCIVHDISCSRASSWDVVGKSKKSVWYYSYYLWIFDKWFHIFYSDLPPLLYFMLLIPAPFSRVSSREMKIKWEKWAVFPDPRFLPQKHGKISLFNFRRFQLLGRISDAKNKKFCTKS